MYLSLLDRYKVLGRALVLIFKRDVSNVTFLWEDSSEEETNAHVIFAEGTSPTEPIFKYFARIAGKSETIESLNNIASNNNLLALRYFAKHNGLDPNDYGVRAHPVTYLKDRTPIAQEEVTTFKSGGVV